MGKIKKILISTSVAMAIGATASGIYYDNAKRVVDEWSNKIYPGITVEGIDLGGMTKNQAEETLKSKYGKVAENKEIIIKADDEEIDINFSDLSPQYDIDDVVAKAMEIGKNKNIFEKQKYIHEGISENLDLTVDYNEDELKKYEEELEM